MFQKFEITVKHSEEASDTQRRKYGKPTTVPTCQCVCVLCMYVCNWGVSGKELHPLSSGFLLRNLQHRVEESSVSAQTRVHILQKHTMYQWLKFNIPRGHELMLLWPTNLICVCVCVCKGALFVTLNALLDDREVLTWREHSLSSLSLWHTHTSVNTLSLSNTYKPTNAPSHDPPTQTLTLLTHLHTYKFTCTCA